MNPKAQATNVKIDKWDVSGFCIANKQPSEETTLIME
jgi:hypothetical protein